MSAYSKFR